MTRERESRSGECAWGWGGVKKNNKHMTIEERKKKLEELRKEYADPESKRNKIGVLLEGKLMGIAIEKAEKH